MYSTDRTLKVGGSNVGGAEEGEEKAEGMEVEGEMSGDEDGEDDNYGGEQNVAGRLREKRGEKGGVK